MSADRRAPTLLLSGFGPFLSHQENPTAQLMAYAERAHFPGWTVQAVILPVAYRAAAERILDAIDRVRPDMVLSFGLAGSAEWIRPERLAHNLDDCEAPDAAGDIRVNRPIDPHASLALPTGIDVDRVVAALRANDLPAAPSRDAGGYVCNHVFYTVRRHRPLMPMGFIHVPPEPRWSLPGREGMTADALRLALRVILDTVRVTSTPHPLVTS